ncbi:ABC transporter substrate-binding protein [Raineyella sp.]|uniref:ABC transporter substrate-binding protein n=1 Tax=Raineyella sp. TaxID=1911550 RepID=UPI002B200346|nr:ABC transporter substrate-binding protein [Raineyella sp.]
MPPLSARPVPVRGRCHPADDAGTAGRVRLAHGAHRARAALGGRARRVLALLAGAALVPLTACGGPGPTPTPADPTAAGQGTYVVGAAVDPLSLDPALVTDPDSLRITRQIFETLVMLPEAAAAATPSPSPTATTGAGTGTGPATPGDPTTTAAAPVDDAVAPGLATAWKATNGGRTYTFTLRQGVKFQDGTSFGPSAVCANVDRWFTFTGRAADPDISAVYQEVFGGFIDSAGTRLAGCTVLGTQQVRLDLTTPMPGLLTQLTRPQFGIQSPTAMATYGAYDTGADPRATPYATAHPTGTGPFRFGAWEAGVQVVLLRNPDYWGSKATVERVLIRTVNDPKARGDGLVKGTLDTYDQITPLEAGSLTTDPKAGTRVLGRAPRDLTYLGIDRSAKAMQDTRVRQAVAMAIDPTALVVRTMPPGSQVADDLIPGRSRQRAYAYDPTAARRLLAEAGVSDLKVRIAYPSGVQQSYLPAPEDLYVAVADQLKAVGITAEPVAMSWPAYLQMLGTSNSTNRPDLHLMGVAMDTPESSSTVSQLLSGGAAEFGLGASWTSATLNTLAGLPAGSGRDAAVHAAADHLLTDPVIVPLAVPADRVAVGRRVTQFTVRPYADEVWSSVRLTG